VREDLAREDFARKLEQRKHRAQQAVRYIVGAGPSFELSAGANDFSVRFDDLQFESLGQHLIRDEGHGSQYDEFEVLWRSL
jgi:hypothetical protein